MSNLFFYVSSEEESKELWDILHTVKGAVFEKDGEQITEFTVQIYVLPTTLEGISELQDDEY